jgi:hypothetical protein
VNPWLLIRRLRGPAFLVLFGILALLNQWDVLSFRRSWPLYLIAAGVLLLVERIALIAFPPPNPPYSSPYPSPYPPVSGAPIAVQPAASPAAQTSPGSEDTASRGNWRT